MQLWIVRDGTEYGPYSVAEIAHFCSVGKILLTETVRTSKGNFISVADIISNQVDGSPAAPGRVEPSLPVPMPQNPSMIGSGVNTKSGWAKAIRAFAWISLLPSLCLGFLSYRMVFEPYSAGGKFLFGLVVFLASALHIGAWYLLAYCIDSMKCIRKSLATISAKS